MRGGRECGLSAPNPAAGSRGLSAGWAGPRGRENTPVRSCSAPRAQPPRLRRSLLHHRGHAVVADPSVIALGDVAVGPRSVADPGQQLSVRSGEMLDVSVWDLLDGVSRDV
ncbi:hypothetical protein GCM10025734_04260 [Kitasatospora paranensis]